MRVPITDSELHVELEGDGEPWLVPCAVGVDWLRMALPLRFWTGRRLVFVELRGTGRSPGAPGTIGVAETVADLARVIDELSLVRPTLLAHSLTGLLALALAAAHPERVAGVVLVGTPPAIPVDAAAVSDYWKSYASEERKRLFEERTAHEAQSGPPQSAAESASWVRLWHDLSRDTTPLDHSNRVTPLWVQEMSSAVGRHDWSATRRSVRCPVLAITGRSDFGVPPTLWRQGDLGLEQLTVEVIDESGHTPFYEQPDSFYEVIAKWVRTARDLG